MKSKFFNYYRPTDEWFAELWATCFFVVDANVLLNLYRYSSKASERLLSILGDVRDRVWIPYQAALEYHERRLDVISAETKTYSDTIKQCKSLREKLTSSQRHPFANDALVPTVMDFLSKLEEDLEKRRTQRDKLLSNDPLQEQISQLFSEKVGDPPSDEANAALVLEGERRYRDKIPPGYKDADKDDRRKYGDLQVWLQIIDWAKKGQKNIVFITDDAKEDWWLFHNSNIVGPRPELLHEIAQEAGVMFYMYRTLQFIEYAQKYLNQQIDRETIDEIRDFSDTELNRSIEENEIDLAERISPKYKAIRRFVSNHHDIKQVLALYEDYDLSMYNADGNPSSIPFQLLDELEPIIRRDSGIVTAIQAVHSLPSDVFERHIKRTRITGEILKDAYLTNNLPGAFIRLLDVLRDAFHINDPRTELKAYLREQNFSEANDIDGE